MNKTGKNLADLQDSNRSQILYYLLRNTGCSRADLGKATGLTLASITKLIRPLIDNGLIFETGFSEGLKGRRTISLSFNYKLYKVLAVKLTWSRLELQVYDFAGTPYDQLVSIPFLNISAENIEKIIETMIEFIHMFQQKYPEICAVGLAVPGPYFRDTSSILLPPYHSNPTRRHLFPIVKRIRDAVPIPVFAEHDAAVDSLGYWWFHINTANPFSVMSILADNGVGIGLVDNGNIFNGSRTSSCEMGHISIRYDGRRCHRCGGKGCISAYCSTEALEQTAQENLYMHSESTLSKLSVLTYDDVFHAMENDDEYANQLVYECGKHFGYGILSLLHVFNPDLIVITGAICRGKEKLNDGIKDALKEGQSSYITIPEIKFVGSEKNSTLQGAAAYAIDRLIQKPTQYFSIEPAKASG